MRSDQAKHGVERMPNRALLYGTGLSQSHMDRPFIGIASSFTDLIPGHTNMRTLERYIERGVENANGTPFIFGVPGICWGSQNGYVWYCHVAGSSRLQFGSKNGLVIGPYTVSAAGGQNHGPYIQRPKTFAPLGSPGFCAGM